MFLDEFRARRSTVCHISLDTNVVLRLEAGKDFAHLGFSTLYLRKCPGNIVSSKFRENLQWQNKNGVVNFSVDFILDCEGLRPP